MVERGISRYAFIEINTSDTNGLSSRTEAELLKKWQNWNDNKRGLCGSKLNNCKMSWAWRKKWTCLKSKEQFDSWATSLF